MNARQIAAEIIVEVCDNGKSLSATLDERLPVVKNPADRGLIQALSFGVIRFYDRLEAILSQLARKPIKDPHIHALALVGLFQLIYLRVKPHAAVSETVSAAGQKTWARSLLNGVLRNFQRQQSALEAEADRTPASRYAHPNWLIEMIRNDWPEEADGILTANNEAPPLVLRVNSRKTQRSHYLSRLSEAGIEAEPLKATKDAIQLLKPIPISQIPGFEEGLVSVQDSAAQLAADFLKVEANERVLDLCAAPGGKTTHLLERYPTLGALTAMDISPERLEKIRENLVRCHLDCILLSGDAQESKPWWDGQPFQKILVDAPCSAIGVIRRHPDIKRLRLPSDLSELTKTQLNILEVAWTVLEKGGELLYATCSILKRENALLIKAFLEKHSDAEEIPLPDTLGRRQIHGLQILPGDQGMDGFFYALIRKH
jgi:16S rRNA (cytosine967-C5)-methyltransferase